jgi:tellurite resistance protein
MPHSEEDRFNIEVIKLLLQVAWSDKHLSPREPQVILGMGRSWSVPEDDLQALMALLQDGSSLPEPELSVLRTRPDDVMVAARALAASDGELDEQEKRFLEEIAGRLQGQSLAG